MKKKNFKIITSFMLATILLCSCTTKNINQNPDQQTPSENVVQTTPVPTEVPTPTPPALTKLTASYDGSTKEGTILNEENEGISVFAMYNNGNELDVTDFTIKSPAKLKAGKTSSVIITYETVQCTLEVKCTSLTAQQYKKKCKTISYKKLARTPDKYEGKKYKFTGKIIQVMESDYYTCYRIDVTKGKYGFWDDTVYVEYWGNSDKRFLEDDIVTFYGESEGLYTYESVLGSSITIPSIDAKYITLNK